MSLVNCSPLNKEFIKTPDILACFSEETQYYWKRLSNCLDFNTEKIIKIIKKDNKDIFITPYDYFEILIEAIIMNNENKDEYNSITFQQVITALKNAAFENDAKRLEEHLLNNYY